jgi:hypothetical protein
LRDKTYSQSPGAWVTVVTQGIGRSADKSPGDVGGSPTGIAVLLGGCRSDGVRLRDVKVDTLGADPSVMAIEFERGSDVVAVEATNQPAPRRARSSARAAGAV